MNFYLIRCATPRLKGHDYSVDPVSPVFISDSLLLASLESAQAWLREGVENFTTEPEGMENPWAYDVCPMTSADVERYGGCTRDFIEGARVIITRTSGERLMYRSWWIEEVEMESSPLEILAAQAE